MFSSFYPPQRTLLGPGPSDVSSRVLGAMARPTIGHLDPKFLQLMDEIKTLLQFAFQTENALTLPISAPGSAGMETCFVNLVSPGDKVIVCQNGVFGGRMKENVERCGGVAIMVEDTWGEPIGLDKVEAAFDAHPDASILAFVHAETSTGVQSDAAALCALAAKRGALSLVDAVTSLGGIEVAVAPAPVPESVPVGAMLATDGLQYVQTRDGAKHLSLIPESIGELSDPPTPPAR